MATADLVLFYAPSLAGDDRIETALSVAAVQLSGATEVWGDLWSAAVACLAGHMLLTTPASTDCAGGDGLTRGQVVSEKSGPESITYRPLTAPSRTAQDLLRTQPGTTFLRMQASLPAVHIAVLD